VGEDILGADIFNVAGVELEFGSNIAMSDDGTRIAVSATKYDWNVTSNSGPGAVLIYDYNGTAWEYTAHIEGDADEKLGAFPISLSSDGQLLAIRRGTLTRPVQVWNVASAGSITQLGTDITCDSNNSAGMVALTETQGASTRLALGCFNDGDNGKVRVVDFIGNTWVEVGDSPLDIDDAPGVAKSLFGFDIAWANDGDQLAVSAPNFNETLTQQGFVRVYTLDGSGSTWNPFGGDIKGTQAGEKLGFTFDLSSNGETLAIGAPLKYVNGVSNAGAVYIYTLVSGVWQLKEEIVANDTDFKLGFGVNLNGDASRLIATSAAAYNSEGGELVVYDIASDVSPSTKIAEFVGAAGDKLTGVAMANDGNSLAIASVGAGVHGIVQVFDDVFTLSPSLSPSASPAPTVDVPANPSLPAFSWSIEPKDNATLITFSEDADTSEIQLFYNISLRNTKIEVYEDDCSTPVPATVTTLTSSLQNTSLTHGDLTVDVNIQQDTILSSPIWTDAGVGEGLISMCVRVDLMLNDDISVNFHETKLYASVSLLQGFEISGIDLNRLNATDENGSADLDYNVIACHCDANRTCVDTVLTQGSDMYICVETTAPNVEIAEIRELTMAQNDFNTTPIVAGVEDPLTFVTIDGKEASIRYQIISAFFADPFPEDIVASGTVLLAFTDDGGRRLLRTSRVNIMQPERELADEVQEGFSVVVGAQGTPSESSGAFARGAFGGGFASLMVVAMTVVVGAVGGTAMVF